jgi:hypothetical protein
MAKKKTLVCFVLDETGSMQIVKDATISGYNEYVDNLRGEKGMSMMLTRFNTAAITIGKPEPIKKATKLSRENYRPTAATPLYDATARAIKKAEEHQNGKSVLCVIMTDGEENSSKEYTKDTLFALVKEKEKEGWKFAYLGANQDAYAEGFKIGIAVADTLSYDQSKTDGTFKVATAATLRYAKNPTASSNFFEDEEKEKVK